MGTCRSAGKADAGRINIEFLSVVLDILDRIEDILDGNIDIGTGLRSEGVLDTDAGNTMVLGQVFGQGTGGVEVAPGPAAAMAEEQDRRRPLRHRLVHRDFQISLIDNLFRLHFVIEFTAQAVILMDIGDIQVRDGSQVQNLGIAIFFLKRIAAVSLLFQFHGIAVRGNLGECKGGKKQRQCKEFDPFHSELSII